MKKHNIIFAAAAVLILTASVPNALAYFTTYVSAVGKKTVTLNDTTDIEESIKLTTKSITITADEGSEPVFVRVRAFWPDGYSVVYNEGNDPKWVQTGTGDDIWWEYTDPIANNGTETYGKKTSTLTIRVSDAPDTVQTGDTFNLVVVYESTPVRYTEDENGNKTPVKNWDEAVTYNGEPYSSDVTPGTQSGTGEGTSGDPAEGTETGGGN